ncbi:hypothetical protein ACEPT7_03125 [Burkholderia ubonensis]|uniref:hypothetical protein n=1 Tax=Burkholderia ubonensis TaxID=101571 RepID=UPI00358F4EF4
MATQIPTHLAGSARIAAARGSAHGLPVLLPLVVLAEILVATDCGISAVLERGIASKEWALDPQTDALVSALIARHEDQLHAAQLAVFGVALDRPDRLCDGQSYDRPPARPGGIGSGFRGCH